MVPRPVSSKDLLLQPLQAQLLELLLQWHQVRLVHPHLLAWWPRPLPHRPLDRWKQRQVLPYHPLRRLAQLVVHHPLVWCQRPLAHRLLIRHPRHRSHRLLGSLARQHLDHPLGGRWVRSLQVHPSGKQPQHLPLGKQLQEVAYRRLAKLAQHLAPHRSGRLPQAQRATQRQLGQ